MQVRVQGIQSKTAPFIAVEQDGYFQVGDKVRIDDNKSLSHMTEGTLVGLIHRGDDTVPMALVHWLENAPPVRCLMSKLVRLKPIKFWMVVGEIEGDYVRASDDEAALAAQRDGTLAPARKFFSRQEAQDLASRMSQRYRRNYILMESTSYVAMSDHQVQSL